MISPALVTYTLKAAFRDKLLWAALVMVVLTVSLSLFSASSAVVEKDQFAIVYMASGLRMFALISLILFVVFFIRRSFDARDIEYLLTRPVSRASLILSTSVAISFLAFLAGIVLALIVYGFAFKLGETEGVLLWMLGVTAELVLMVNVALFFSMVLSSPVTAGMAVMGFYVLARMMGTLLGIIREPTGFVGETVLVPATKIISVLVPRLDLMTQTSWLIYGTGNITDYVFIIVQAAVFLGLVLVATLIDLVRRQF